MFDTIGEMFGGSGMGVLLKTGGAVLTVLVVVPAVMKLFLVTIDEGSAAIRTRNGKPIMRRAPRGQNGRGEVVVLRPGTHGAFPIFYWYRRVDVRARSTDLPARHLTGGGGHLHLVLASFDWRPVVSGHDLTVFELDVVNVPERTGNIVGAALRDIVRVLDEPVLPANEDLSPRLVKACADEVRARCGVELVNVMITGDALTDGYLLAEALRAAAPDSVAASRWDAVPTVLGTRLTPVG